MKTLRRKTSSQKIIRRHSRGDSPGPISTCLAELTPPLVANGDANTDYRNNSTTTTRRMLSRHSSGGRNSSARRIVNLEGKHRSWSQHYLAPFKVASTSFTTTRTQPPLVSSVDTATSSAASSLRARSSSPSNTTSPSETAAAVTQQQRQRSYVAHLHSASSSRKSSLAQVPVTTTTTDCDAIELQDLEPLLSRRVEDIVAVSDHGNDDEKNHGSFDP